MATTWGELAFTVVGRLIALAGAAVCCAWAFDLTYRATGFWALLIFGYVLLREVLRA